MMIRALVTYVSLMACLVVASPALSQATSGSDALSFHTRLVQHLALNPTVVRAVRRQNAMDLADAEIQDRERSWGKLDRFSGLKWELQENSAGRFLQSVIDRNDLYGSAFVTDRRGATVAAYPDARAYFHGESDLWKSTLASASGRVWSAGTSSGSDASGGNLRIAAPIVYRGETIGLMVVTIAPEQQSRLLADAAR